MADARTVIFDVETTGTDKRRDQVIELCVQFGLKDDSESRVWRIRPSVAISPGAQKVHGISMEELEGCPSFREYADEIRDIFERADTLVGYNLAFDIEMLQAEYERIGQPAIDLSQKEIVDAFRLWQQCEPRSLQDAHRRFAGGEFSAAHSAAADVAATGRVLLGMIDAFGLADKQLSEVAMVCEPERKQWLGTSRHIRWSEAGVPEINFGRHKGAAVHELASIDGGGYLRWVVGKDFPRHVTEVCKKALEFSGEDFLLWVRQAYGWDESDATPAAPVSGPPVATTTTTRASS
jgi:DNA polymerase-3 subunit epsilon